MPLLSASTSKVSSRDMACPVSRVWSKCWYLQVAEMRDEVLIRLDIVISPYLGGETKSLTGLTAYLPPMTQHR